MTKTQTAELSLKQHSDLRRRFLFMLPAVFVTYSLAYLDRANFGLGAAAGLSETLHITGAQTSLISASFFLGYFLFQIPGAAFARKHGAAKLVFTALFTWGVLASLTGVIRNFWLLVIDRFFIGVAESIIFPVILLLLTRWFTKGERSRANTFLILGNPVTVLWMSAVTGKLIDSLGWQKTFIVEGLPSILWAFVWILFIKDFPSQTGWLKRESVATLDAVLLAEQAEVAEVKAVREALFRPDVLLLAVQYFCWSLGIYGFVLWLPTIVRQGSGAGMGTTGLLTAIPYAVAAVFMLAASSISDRTMKRAPVVWPFLMMAGFAMLGSYFASGKSFPVAFVCLVLAGAGMYAPYGPYFAIIPERVPKNVTGEVMAMINSAGALGGFVGSYFVGWLQAATGGPKAGFLLMSIAVIVSSLLILLLPRQRTLSA